LLGLVLGSIMERNFFLSYSLSGYAWLGRPSVLLLAALAVGLLWPTLGARLRRPARSETVRVTAGSAPAERPGAGREQALLSLLLALMATTALVQVWDAPLRVRQFPLLVAIPMLVLALWQLGRDLLGGPAGRGQAAADPTSSPPFDVPTPSQGWPALGWLGAFFLALWALGFTLAIPIYTVVYLRLAARASLPLALGLALVAGAFFWLLFVHVLHLPLFEGALSRALAGRG
jgi:hypothetical protein